MKSATVRSHLSVALYKDISFDRSEFLEIVQIHHVPDLFWLGENPGVAVRIRDPLPAEVQWLDLAPGAMVAVAATAPGVVFAYFAGATDESELVAVVVHYRPDPVHCLN